MKLRDYQEDAINRIEVTFTSGVRGVFLVMPCGAGKTVVFTDIIRRYVEREKRCVVVAHRQELIYQAGRTIIENSALHHGIIKACDSTFPLAPVQIASIDSMRTRQLPWEPDLIVLDEAHLVKAKRYMAFLNQYPHAKLLLVSATPIRLDNRGFRDLAGEIIIGNTIQGLIEHPGGPFLVPPRIYTGSEITEGLKSVKTLAGEYNQGQLENLMSRTQLVGDVTTQYLSKAMGRKGIVFCVGVKHSQAVCQQFNSAGIKAEHLDGAMNNKQRAGILERLRTGETTVITNCAVLCEGFDETSVSYIGLARPTKSLALYIQQAGRGLRICPEIRKTDCVIIDHANHIAEHGHLLEDHHWTLDGTLIIKKKKKKNYKECPVCGMWLPKTAQICDGCGYRWPGRTVNVIQADFREAKTNIEALHPVEREYRALLRFAKTKGYKSGWAYFRLIEKFGQEDVKTNLSYGKSKRHQSECYFNSEMRSV